MTAKKLLVIAGMLAGIGARSAAAQVLQFDQVPGATTTGGVGVAIGEFYNGAGGTAFDYGVEFVGEANAFCFDYTGSTCNTNTSYGDDPASTLRNTERAGMLFLGTPAMNRTAGFTTGFSFFYSNPGSVASAFEVWSGLNGTGTMLASLSLAGTSDGVSTPGCFGDNYCGLVAAGVSFAGTAESVVFTGGANSIAYDDITFGSATAGGTTSTPEPASIVLVASGLAGLGVVTRRRRSVH